MKTMNKTIMTKSTMMKTKMAWSAAVIVALLVFLPSCSDDSSPLEILPVAESDTSFFPLAIGSEWTYHHTFDVQFLRESDGGNVYPPIHEEADGLRELTEIVSIDGVDYVAERQTFGTDTEQPVVGWRYYRQDEFGMFRALIDDVSPSIASNLTDVEELQRIQYPLQVGDEWSLTDDAGSTVATVIAEEEVEIGGKSITVYVIDLRNSDIQPPSFRHVRFSRCGLMSVNIYAEFRAMDSGTGQIIRIERRETEVLISASPRHRSCGD